MCPPRNRSVIRGSLPYVTRDEAKHSCGPRLWGESLDTDPSTPPSGGGSRLNWSAEGQVAMGGTGELKCGEVFAGRYEVQRSLGEGDRKRTYLARDSKLDRLVAVSLVKPEAVRLDPGGTEREAKVLGRIGSNANI